MYSDLTIVTITYNETKGLLKTAKSINSLLSNGAKWIVVSKLPLQSIQESSNIALVQGKDNGLYNALNIGVALVKTKYYMLLHADDLICDMRSFGEVYDLIRYRNLDMILGGSKIGNRQHLSLNWRPWMFHFHVQPPHLPIIYNTSKCSKIRFSESISTIADFYCLKDMFKAKLSYVHTGKVYIKMGTGGLTTSGLKSALLVTREFAKVEGQKAWLIAPFRIILKAIMK